MSGTRLRHLLAILALLLAGAFTGTFAAGPVRAIQSEQAQPAQAKAEPAGGQEEPDPADTTAGTIFRWLNFIAVFGAIGYLVAKKGGPAFRANAKKIAAGITSAAAAKAEADVQLRAAEAGLAKLPQDTVAMRESAKKEFAAESERLREAGKQEVARIENAATAEISAARRAARIELRAMTARGAALRAAELVPGQISAAQRAALVKQFVDELPASANEPRGVN